MNGHRLNHDRVGELLGKAESGVADLTDDIGRMADEANLLIFAEAHFAEAVGHLGCRGVLLDANGDAGLNMAQRAHVAVGALTLDDDDFFGFLFHQSEG